MSLNRHSGRSQRFRRKPPDRALPSDVDLLEEVERPLGQVLYDRLLPD
jgi:hypothetical protein